MSEWMFSDADSWRGLSPLSVAAAWRQASLDCVRKVADHVAWDQTKPGSSFTPDFCFLPASQFLLSPPSRMDLATVNEINFFLPTLLWPWCLSQQQTENQDNHSFQRKIWCTQNGPSIALFICRLHSAPHRKENVCHLPKASVSVSPLPGFIPSQVLT